MTTAASSIARSHPHRTGVTQWVNGGNPTGPSTHNEASLSMTVAISSDQPFTASLNCGDREITEGQSEIHVDSVRLNALAVDNIQSQ